MDLSQLTAGGEGTEFTAIITGGFVLVILAIYVLWIKGRGGKPPEQ